MARPPILLGREGERSKFAYVVRTGAVERAADEGEVAAAREPHRDTSNDLNGRSTMR